MFVTFSRFIIEFLVHFAHDGGDVDALWAVAGAGTACEAVGRSALRVHLGEFCLDGIVPLGIHLVVVVNLEELGNIDPHGASVAAVAASGAGDVHVVVEHFTSFKEQLTVGISEVVVIVECRQVILHLLHRAHATQDGLYLWQTADKAERPRGY